jgi:proteic killer suppression protein
LTKWGPLDILFSKNEWKQLCEDERVAKRKLGAATAKKLRTRLADLRAASRVTDLIAGRPHPLTADRAGQFAVDLAGGVRLVFEPSSDPPPAHDDGSIDWRQVTAVTIVFIGDYHD